MIDKTISHYRILRELGAGGMGVVYLAEDTLLKRRVAIKMLNASGNGNGHQYRTRLLREARAVSQISHSHIATIHEFGDTPDGHPFIVMEFIDGETLADVIKRKALTIQRTIEIISQVAEALSEAHSHGIVHRDIKPSNIAINHRGEVKVLDFGLAKQIEAETLQRDSGSSEENLLSTRTREGVILGTPLYLSPEQALGVPVDERSDIFSLGTVLYECLTGKQPFLATSVIEICAKVLRDNPPPPSKHNPNVSSGLDEITLKALSKQPEERYQTAGELLKDLHALEYKLKEERTIITNPIVPDAETKPITGRIRTGVYDILNQRRTLTIAFAGALFIGLLLAGFWFLRNGAPPAPTPEAERLYEEGVVHFHNGAFHQAKQSFTKATEADNKFALAYARLAETYAEMDYEDKAQNEMLRATSLISDKYTGLTSLDSTSVQASNAIVLRDLPAAIEKYQTLAGKSPDTKKSYALLDLARAYEKNESPDEAIKTYQDVLKISPNNATALLRLGIAYSRQSKEKEATEYFTKAEESFRAAYNNEGIAETLYQIGTVQNDANKLADAQNTLQSTLELARANNFRYQQVKVMLQLGSVYYTQNKTELSKQYISDALGIAHAEDMDSIAADGLVDYGNAFLASGKLDEGMNQIKNALELAGKVKAKRAEARAALSLGSLLQFQSKYEEASSYIEKALGFYEPKKYRRKTAQALQLKARILYGKGDYTNAKSSFEKLLNTANELNDNALKAAAHSELGILLNLQEQYADGLRHIEESRKLNSALGDIYNLGYDWANKADMLYKLGRYDEASNAFQQAEKLESQSKEGNKDFLAFVTSLKARMALTQRNFSEAKKLSGQSLALVGKQNTRVSAISKLILGLAQSLTKESARGIKVCEEAFELATLMNDPRLIAYTRIALAESQLEAGDNSNAIKNALQSYEKFTINGQRDSEWHSLVIIARAYNSSGDKENAKKYVTLANEALNKLRRAYNSDDQKQYFNRHDVQNYITQLGAITD